MKWKAVLFRYVPAISWMAVIFILSHQPASELDSWMPFFQKYAPAMESFDWGHFVAYFILAVTYYWLLLPSFPGWKGRVLTVIACLLYGLTDEFHQSFVPGRTPDWIDLRNDGIGATVAILFMSIPQVNRIVRTWARSIIY